MNKRIIESYQNKLAREENFVVRREYCQDRCGDGDSIFKRKFFYVFTCEYCFSHWTTLLILLLTGFQLLIDDWRGYVLAFFAIPWLANQLMSIYRRLRVGIKHEKLKAKEVESNLE